VPRLWPRADSSPVRCKVCAPAEYFTEDFTAQAGEHYFAQFGTLSFTPGETSQTITIEVMGDITQEDDEEFFVDLFGDDNIFWSIIKTRGVGTILNDD
jgi:hypothetical protein